MLLVPLLLLLLLCVPVLLMHPQAARDRFARFADLVDIHVVADMAIMKVIFDADKTRTHTKQAACEPASPARAFSSRVPAILAEQSWCVSLSRVPARCRAGADPPPARSPRLTLRVSQPRTMSGFGGQDVVDKLFISVPPLLMGGVCGAVLLVRRVPLPGRRD